MNKKVQYGNIEVPEADFESKNYKVRITIMVDGDLLEAYKKKAELEHTKYQTLMNQKLRESLESTHSDFSKRLEIIEKKMADLAAARKLEKEMLAQMKRFSRLHALESSTIKAAALQKRKAKTG